MCLAFVACTPDGDLLPIHDTGSGLGPACDVVIVETLPANGAGDAYWRGAVEFVLSEPDPTARVLADFDGVQTTRGDGHVVVFTPTEPLAPDTTYDVTLDYCHGAPTISFTTSDFGEAIADVSALQGRTFVADLSAARFPDGSALAGMVSSFFTDRLLIGIPEISDDEITLRIALADESGAGQDTCFRTLDLPAAHLFEAPYFEATAHDVTFGAYAGHITLRDLTFSGTIDAAGTAVAGATVEAVVDARELATALDFGDPETLCELAEGVGLPCGPCPDDASETCATLRADHVSATLLEGVFVDEIVEPEIDPACDQ